MANYQIKGLRENATGGFDEAYIPEPHPYHGIQACGALSFDNSTHILTMASGANTYWISGTRYTTASAISCDLDSYVTLTANTAYWLYFDDTSGTLKATAGAINLKTVAPVATVFWNGSAGAVQFEKHNHTRDIDWHIWAHDTIGCRYESGLSQTNPTTTNDALLQIETGTIHDEDQDYTTGQCTTMRGWYKASANVYTFSDYSLPYLGTSGQPQYLDTDTYTLTNVSAANFACYWVYATLDKDRPIYVVPTTAATDHTTIALARAEVAPTLSGLNLNAEWKLIYRWIYKGDGNYQEVVDYRSSSPVPGGGTASTTAGSVSFTPYGNVASATVQAAIQELDDEKQAVLVSGTTIKTVNSTSLLGSGDIAITVPVKATGAELLTGTDDAKFATAKALKDGEYIAIHVGTTAPANTSILWLDTN